jgi:hypothetical protein
MVDTQTVVEKAQRVSTTSDSRAGFTASTAVCDNLSAIIRDSVLILAIHPADSALAEAEPVCEEQNAPTLELCEVSEATVQGIRRGILEIATGRSKGPFSASELIRCLDTVAKR